MQYFAQDEATRLDPALSVYETMSADSPTSMVPAIRNILGGFLFSGDDIYKKAGVLSGGERTRLAVARMLLIPSNTLLLDEPTNHLDLDSKDILLEALEDYGGTLIFVSHDRYFVEKLATKIVEIGHGEALGLSGNVLGVPVEQGAASGCDGCDGCGRVRSARRGREGRMRDLSAEARQRRSAEPQRAVKKNPAADHDAAQAPGGGTAQARPGGEEDPDQISDLEARIAEREQAMKEIEAAMSAPGFYENRDQAQPLIDRHQALMWELGELMHQWEELQEVSYSPAPQLTIM